MPPPNIWGRSKRPIVGRFNVQSRLIGLIVVLISAYNYSVLEFAVEIYKFDHQMLYRPELEI